MEAEFIAASEASKEAVWLEKLRKELGDQVTDPPTLCCDNEGAEVQFMIRSTKQTGWLVSSDLLRGSAGL
jgi:hypothetical protein